MWLEAVADLDETSGYLLRLGGPSPPAPLPGGEMEEGAIGDRSVPRADWRPMLSAILDDVSRDVEPGIIAARFHNAIADWAFQAAMQHPLRDVVLIGGCFQNRLLTEHILAALRRTGCRAHCHSQVPPGDGGLAVGQLAVAMART